MSSALGMDKDVAKRLATQAGIPTPAWRVVREDGLHDLPATVDRLADQMGLPVFVKPAALGSSVGITKAGTEAQLKEGLEIASLHGPKVIVEEATVRTMRTTGRALFFTTAVLTVAFSIYGLAEADTVSNFGKLTALAHHIKGDQGCG